MPIFNDIRQIKIPFVKFDYKELCGNIRKNIPLIKKGKRAESLKNKWKDNACVVVGAGPSLDKNRHLLLKYRPYLKIISVDTALQPLLRIGVRPDFTVTVDKSIIIREFFRDLDTRDIPLLSAVYLHPDAIREYQGNKYFFSPLTFLEQNIEYASLVKQFSKKIIILRAGGSVSFSALAWAVYLGANPIIFVGQDFAYTNGRVYCSDSYYDDMKRKEVCEERTYEQLQKEWTANISNTSIKRSNGEEIPTEKMLIVYVRCIEQLAGLLPNIKIINSTGGGILTLDSKNILEMPFERAVERHCIENLVHKELDKAGKHEEKGDYLNAIRCHKEVLKIRPLRIESYLSLAILYKKCSRHKEALSMTRKGLELGESAMAYYIQGMVYSEMERNEDALLSYQKAIKIEPSYPEVYMSLGLLSLEKYSRIPEALAFLEKYVELKKEGPSLSRVESDEVEKVSELIKKLRS